MHILVAEDETAVRHFVTRALTQRGHRVVEASDGLQAWQALSEQSFDLLLSDIVMPELDGLALALKVAESYPALPVILMSGFADARRRAHNMDEIVFDVLAKPFTLAELDGAVTRAIEKG